MRKRFLSLLCVLALCLGLLSVTALAAVPSEQAIYVGEENVASGGYWTTGNDGTVTAFTGEGTPADNFIHYDATNNVLTLHNATIKESVPFTTSTYVMGAGIGVFNQNGNAELTIALEGTNTIAEVSMGIYVLASFESTVSSSLTITGDGSLDASGSQIGIRVQSNSGGATLEINSAEVKAVGGTYTSCSGVWVQAQNGSDVSLTVDGGSLTASGDTGICLLFGSSESGSGTPSLAVSGNAIVRANSGISDNSSADIQIGADSSGNTGGIVFDDGEGTVYGSVTLQEDLEIDEGESLKLDDGANLSAGSHNVIVDGGTVDENLEQSLSGSVKYAPTITTASLPNGTVNEEYSQTLAADGDATITWSSSGLPEWLTLDGATGVISGTPTTAGTSTFTVKAENSYGSDSEELSITISAPASVSVTGVSLNKDSLNLYVGDNETLTATVEPTDATNQKVTWSSSAESVATVDANGVVAAVAPGTATITVTTEDGGKTATCAVTVNAATVPVTGVTLSQTQASLYSNRTPNTLTLTATVAPDDATNKAVTWTSSNSTVATVDANGKVTAVGAGEATITVTTEDGNKTATCAVTVSRYSSGGGSSSRPTPSLSDQAIDKIEDARPGDTVEITLRPGRTTLEREVFESLAGQNITLEIDAGDGVLWTVNGLDIPEDTRLHDLDLDVDLGDSDIPAAVLNAVTGETGAVQLSLKHDGAFGFTMSLSAPLGRENADLWANLYWYNERSEELEFQQAVRIGRDGTAKFALDHASDYAIVIDTDSHEPVELPFRDVPENAWYADAAAYVYRHGLMAGTSATTFAPDMTTSRAMIVTILWRLAGSPQVDYLMDYSDVSLDSYYAEAIRWATSEGIVGGYGGGVFGPDDPITREQLAAMLWRYAQHEGYDVGVGEDTNILSYTDAFDVAEYAIPAMQWACGAGVINGTGDGSTLSPQGEATRAQAAVMLMRFCEEYVTW